MTLKDWWKSKQYWVKGGIIGFCVSIILVVILVFIGSENLQCGINYSPSCKDYLSMFTDVFIFFAPICTLIGLIIGLIIDKIKSPQNNF